jgi:hypothetical protein
VVQVHVVDIPTSARDLLALLNLLTLILKKTIIHNHVFTFIRFLSKGIGICIHELMMVKG